MSSPLIKSIEREIKLCLQTYSIPLREESYWEGNTKMLRKKKTISGLQKYIHKVTLCVDRRLEKVYRRMRKVKMDGKYVFEKSESSEIPHECYFYATIWGIYDSDCWYRFNRPNNITRVEEDQFGDESDTILHQDRITPYFQDIIRKMRSC